MGSLDNSNQTSEDLESERALTSIGNESSAHYVLAHDESLQFGSNKRLLSFTSCSSSISSDSSQEDPLKDLQNEHDKSSLKLEADDQLATEHDEKPNEEPSDPGTPTSPSTPPANDYISENPPIQLMARPESSKYRIPSHVFARKKSTNTGDWSMASNESLFSIPMGGTSFCNPDSLIWHSGELGLEASISSPLFDLPDESQELGGEDEVHELGKVNNQESSMLDEPINSDNKEDRQSTADERTSHFSADSTSSSKSFVFPVLAGETDKGSSPNPHGSLLGVPEEPKLGPEPLEPSKTKPETKKPTPLIAWSKWFPCFRYCTCCS